MKSIGDIIDIDYILWKIKDVYGKNHHSERNDNQIQIEITSFLMKNMSKKKLHLNLDTCKVGNEAHKIL